MKTQMLIALTLAVALTALVLATWPVVADAPWEGKETIVRIEEHGPDACERMWQNLAAAQTNTAAFQIRQRLQTSCRARP